MAETRPFLAWLPAPGFVTPPERVREWQRCLADWWQAELVEDAAESRAPVPADPILLPGAGTGRGKEVRWWGQARLGAARSDAGRSTEARLEDRGGGSGGTDSGVLGRAWERWGPSTPAHLGGEYAAVGWDPRERRLWAIRDSFGIEPLYFAETPCGVAVSNLPGLAMSAPGAGDELDELGVVDHLLFDVPGEPEGTLWRSLRRLPPGAVTSWTSDPSEPSGWRRGETRISSPLSAGPSPMPAAPEAVIETFADHLSAALVDRLPERGGVVVSMSGGLDSVVVAALGAALPAVRAPGIAAHTLVYRRLLPDLEGPPSADAARALGLPHVRFAMDDYPSFAGWRDLPMGPIPGEAMADAIYHDFDLSVLERTSVVWSGWGGDPLLLPELRWWRATAARHGWLAALAEGWGAFRLTGRRPPLGLHGAASGALRRWREGRRPPVPPPWLNRELARRTEVGERLARRLRAAGSGSTLAVPRWADGFRPAALRHTLDPGWAHHFERIHWGARGNRLVRRHPFFDARLARFALSLPTLPWCLEKHLMRRVLAGRVPETVWRRPKTPLGGDPRHGVRESLGELWREWLEGAPELEQFLDTAAVGAWLATPDGRSPTHGSPWRPALAFACWLCRLRRQGPGDPGAAHPSRSISVGPFSAAEVC